MATVLIFTVGSAICGGASNGGGLVAGRAAQGIGSAGLNMIVDMIVSDLVPLRERGNFIAIILTVYFIGAFCWWHPGRDDLMALGFSNESPVGAVTLVLFFIFLHVNYNKEMKSLSN